MMFIRSTVLLGAALFCSFTAGGSAESVQDGLSPEVLFGQDESSPEVPEVPTDVDPTAFNCSFIEDIFAEDPEAFTGTKFVEIQDKCKEGVLKTPEDVAAIIEDVAAPNPSIDEQIVGIADGICELVSKGEINPDADVSEIKAACLAEPRDDDAVVDAASILQAKMAPKDEVADAELEETCLSIAANRDKIEAALLVLAERSSERKLQDDSGNETAPVTSFVMATEMLTMYDCLCDQSNPDNLGCMKKAIKFAETVAQAVDEQAATDFNPERVLDDIEETVEFVKTHASHLRHTEYGSNDVDLSIERALSESSVGVCDPPGISDTWQNGGKKLCLYAGDVFECEVNWNPQSSSCFAVECGAGKVLQIKGSVQLCFPGPNINIEIKLCISVISEILEAIGIWVPGAEKFFNGFNIYSGCYRLALAEYDIANNRLMVTVGPLKRWVVLNVFVKVGGSAAFRFKGSGCAYLDSIAWASYELAANSRDIHFGEVSKPDNFWFSGFLYSLIASQNPGWCPISPPRWALFQIYVGVELEWFWGHLETHGHWEPWKWTWESGVSYTNIYSFEKYFIAK